jgi:hypothetical protein
MHPLAKRAALEAMRGFSPQFLAGLREALVASSAESLRDAVRELIFLGVILEEIGAVKESASLFLLVESQEIIAALDRANASRVADQDESLARGAKRFARFAGAEAVQEMRKEATAMKLKDFGARRFAGLRLR